MDDHTEVWCQENLGVEQKLYNLGLPLHLLGINSRQPFKAITSLMPSVDNS